MWKKINDLSNKFFPWGCLLVSACQFFEGSCVGGLGWLISGVMWWLQEESERDFKELSRLFELSRMFSEHLADDKEKEDKLINNPSNQDLKDKENNNG